MILEKNSSSVSTGHTRQGETPQRGQWLVWCCTAFSLSLNSFIVCLLFFCTHHVEPASIPTKCITQRQTVPIKYDCLISVYAAVYTVYMYVHCYNCLLCFLVQVFIVVHWFRGTVWRRLHQENTLDCKTKTTGELVNGTAFLDWYVRASYPSSFQFFVS